MPKTDPRVTKRRVTMRSVSLPPEPGMPMLETMMVDYVRPDFLTEYVAKAREVWQSVEVSDEPDAGPGGYEGATTVPADLDHPLAGQHFPAETKD